MSGRDVGLDVVDRQIITALQADGRRAFTRIARELGVSESQVRSRVARLEEAGVMQVVAVTNPIALGFEMTAMIGLQVAPAARQALAAGLAGLPEVSYLVVTAGGWDILCEVVCADHEHLQHFLSDTLATFDGIRATQTLVYLRILKESYGWSATEQPPPSRPPGPEGSPARPSPG